MPCSAVARWRALKLALPRFKAEPLDVCPLPVLAAPTVAALRLLLELRLCESLSCLATPVGNPGATSTAELALPLRLPGGSSSTGESWPDASASRASRSGEGEAASTLELIDVGLMEDDMFPLLTQASDLDLLSS